MAKDANATKTVGLLIEAANADTVFRDLYLRRARQLLSATLDESAYRAIGSTRKRSRSYRGAGRRWYSGIGIKRQISPRKPIGCANGRRLRVNLPLSERMFMTRTQWPLILFPRKAPGSAIGSKSTGRA